MSTIVEQDEEVSVEEPVEVEQEVAEPEFDMPEKYAGKSIEDVIQMHQNSEKELGRQGNELGELRKTTDSLLGLQLEEKRNKQKVEEAPVLDVDSLLDDPSMAINNAINSNSRLKQIEEQLLTQSREKSKSQFESNHPNWEQTVNDSKFQAWVQEDSERRKQFHSAHNEYNYAAADNLFTFYEAVNGAAPPVKSSRNTKKLKAAAVESGSTGAKSTKVYRRADLINLRINDPQKYEAMQDDIYKAYAENRVR